MRRIITVAGITVLVVVVITVAATMAFGAAPAIPHTLEDRSDCVTCHGPGGSKQYPSWHEDRGYENADCTRCHDRSVD